MGVRGGPVVSRSYQPPPAGLHQGRARNAAAPIPGEDPGDKLVVRSVYLPPVTGANQGRALKAAAPDPGELRKDGRAQKPGHRETDTTRPTGTRNRRWATPR